jgi:AraC-like DNA-binding protein
MEPVRQLILMVPSDALHATSNQRFEALAVLGERGGVGQIVGDFIRSVASNLPYLTGGRRAEVGEALIAMLRLAYAEEHDRASSVSMRDTARDRAKAFIAFNLTSADLSVGMIAQALGYTKRHIHRLFEDDGMTIAHYIRHERLDRCRDDLRDKAQSDQSITQIALAWGFSDSAYFSNAFKREFGVSPREYRAMSRAE